MEQRVPTTWYLWISRIAGAVGIILCIMAAINGIAGYGVFPGGPSTLVRFAIAAFLFAIWSVLYELRDYGIRTRK